MSWTDSKQQTKAKTFVDSWASPLSAIPGYAYIAAMSEPQRSTCLVCDRPPHIRGLCSRCYSEARAAIGEDVVTESELMQRGLMLPPHSRKKVGPFMAALKKSRTDAVASPAAVEQVPKSDEPATASWSIVCDVGSDVKKD